MKYEVTLRETEIYVIEVEADSEEEATENAYIIFENASEKGIYHYDSDSESSAYEIEE